MSIDAMFNNTFTNSRETSSVYTKAPPVEDDQTPSITITTPDNLEVVISGFSLGTGSVTITGTDTSNDALSETITFPGNGQKISLNEFKTITRVQTSGLANEATTGTLTIKTATGSGEDQPIFTTVGKFVGRIARPKSSEAFTFLGERSDKAGVIFTKAAIDIEIGDRVVDDDDTSDIWEVESIQKRYKRVGQVQHLRLVVTELESPAL